MEPDHPTGAEPPERTEEEGDRDSLGRFVKGHSSPGPGGPRGPRARTKLLRMLDQEDVSDELVSRLVAEALTGKSWAHQLIWERIYPRTVNVEMQEDASRQFPVEPDETEWDETVAILEEAGALKPSD